MSRKRPTNPKAQFGQRLRELRRSAGLSQEELADRAGLDRTYVSSCERGHRNVSLITVCSFAAALSVAPATLLEPPASIPTKDML